MEGPGLEITVAVLVAAVAIGGVANWQLRRPAHERLWPAMPWLGVQFLAALIVLVLAAHLVTLATGRHFGSRNGY